MNRFRIAMHLSLVLAVAISLVAFFVPTEAKANCYYPIRVVTEYYGWYTVSGSVACSMNVSPYIPPELVGERIIECDGSITTWGDLSCTNNRESYAEVCEPICN